MQVNDSDTGNVAVIHLGPSKGRAFLSPLNHRQQKASCGVDYLEESLLLGNVGETSLLHQSL